MTPLSASTPKGAPATTAGSPTGSTPSGTENAGFAAILDGAAGRVPIAVKAISAEVDAAVVPTPGKTTGKALPDIAAAALAQSAEAAPAKADNRDTPSDPTVDADDAKDIDPAEALLAILAVLSPIPAKPAPQPAAAQSPAAFVAAKPVGVGPSAPATTVALMADVGAPKAALPDTAGAAVLTTPQAAASTAFAQVQLAPIETTSADNPKNGAAPPHPVLAALSAQAPTPPTPTSPTEPTQPATASPSTAPVDAGGATVQPTVADRPAQMPAASTAVAQTDERATLPADRQPAPPSLHDASAGEIGQPLAPSQVPLAHASAPVPAATGAISRDTAPAPQDFATLVSRIAEAREAAGSQVVRTAVSHTEFGSVSLQFRPESSGLTVTMASADPAFGAAVHAGVAASLAGGAGGDRGDQGGDARQAWQQSGNGTQTQTGSGTFQQDQRQASAQTGNTSTGRQDGERRHAPPAPSGTELTGRDDRPARAPRTDRGGIYA
ncbi:hypothetical protein EDF56_104393 [Novosphingobium sp. PhB165]|uniref:hypothetical protein n=1 Tax=Novosphingobium sp. PhB165 TaxID=2485105 RepID=UPI001042A7C0|nr:hypothetical protein [Novosphingobium sp. PhB165]TCM18859.1 hypothetical protein EDF56_104393 [Novosphingobium sp. PhB165]